MDRRQFVASLAAFGAVAGRARAQGPRGMAASSEAVGRLQQRLARLDEDGLDPRWYDVAPGMGDAAVARAAGLVLADLVQGRAAIPASRVDLRRDATAHPLGPWLQRLAESVEPALLIDRASLAHADAPALKAALVRARAMPATAPVPMAGGTLEPGAADPARVPALRARLAVADPVLAAMPGEGETYDEALQAAVRRFQAASGLEADGRIGAATFAALNRSPQVLVTHRSRAPRPPASRAAPSHPPPRTRRPSVSPSAAPCG